MTRSRINLIRGCASQCLLAALCLRCSAFLPEIGPSRGSLVDAADVAVAPDASALADAAEALPDATALADAGSSFADAVEDVPSSSSEGSSLSDVPAFADGPSTDAPGDEVSGLLPDAGHRTWTVLVGPNGAHAFSPPTLLIGVGDTVDWVWQTSGHTVIGGTGPTADGRFCSPTNTQCQNAPTSSAGDSYAHSFSAAGDFPYFCAQHSDMIGLITVR